MASRVIQATTAKAGRWMQSHTPDTHPHQQRPLVVLIGWLGCTPRLLRRYESLWQAQGCAVLSYIPTPTLVVRSVLATPTAQKVWEYPRSWPHKVHAHPATMQEAAWNVLAQAHTPTEPMILWHVFSNAGCFVWEQVRILLGQGETAHESHSGDATDYPPLPDPIRLQLQHLRRKTVGVIFDSGPGQQLHHIDYAMNYVSWQERLQTCWIVGAEWVLYRKTPEQVARIQQRQAEYWHHLRDDPWKLPQLYLYSESDPLIAYTTLNEFVTHRQAQLGNDVIWKRTWTESPHCAHYLQHPEEYKQAISEFASHVILDTQQRAKL
jgi:hypothetical protein